jgi:hypothetical protein
MQEHDDIYRRACGELLEKAERNLIEIPAMIGRITRLSDCVLFYQMGYDHRALKQSLDELKGFDRFIRDFAFDETAISPIYTEPVARALAVADYPEWQRRGFCSACFHVLSALTVMSAIVRALNEVRRCTPEMLLGDRGRIAWLKRVLGFPIHPDDLPF